MADATNIQIQNWCNSRLRPHAALARSLVLAFLDDIASIAQVYAALTDTQNPNPPFVDSATTTVYSLQASDILAFNAFMNDISTAMKNHASYPIVLAACVNPPQGFSPLG